jgi:membrane-associated protease RseP (regulator of RpoE activity)
VKTDDELTAHQELEAAKAADGPASPTPPPFAFKAPDRRISLALLVGLILFMGIAGGWQLLVIVGAIVVMIFLHELGHFITAKKCGMKVTEFFIGFGPRLWSFQRGETEYGVKLLPAGAYVRIIGMNNLDEVPPEDEPRTYRQQSYPKRVLVASAGSGMHFLLTLICVFMLLAVTGVPGGHLFKQVDRPYAVDVVNPDGAAAAAGLVAGDKILTVDGVDVSTTNKLKSTLADHKGEAITLVILHDGQTREATTTLGTDTTKGLLGIQLTEEAAPNTRVAPVTAVGRTFTEFGSGVAGSIDAIRTLFSPSGIGNLAGQVRDGGSPTVDDNSSTAPSSGSHPSSDNSDRPISIIGAARIGTGLLDDGLRGFLVFFAFINLFIGIVNMIPLLPLDGGHVAIATYERFRSRKGRQYRVDVVKLLPLTYAVVMLLALLFISTVFLDLVDPISIN